jgi:hypothetical protein
MPRLTLNIFNLFSELGRFLETGRKFILHFRVGSGPYLPAMSMTLWKTRKKFPPQIFSISRSV